MKKISGLQLAMYICAGVLAIIFIIMTVSSVQYITEYCASYGVTFGDMLGEGLKYILTQSVSYLVYAGIFFALGKIAGKVEYIKSFYELTEEEACAMEEMVCEEVAAEEMVCEEAAEVKEVE